MPALRIVLALIGAYAGIAFGGELTRVFDALAGALIGFALAQLWELRARVASLTEELVRLRASLGAPRTQPAQTAAQTAAQPLPAQPPPPRPLPAQPLPAQASPAAWRDLEPPRPRSAERDAPAAAPPAGPAASAVLPAFEAVRAFLTGGNTLVRVGVVVLLFGVAFLLRYMAEHTRLPVALRLSGVAAAAIALLGLGWRLRRSRTQYALAIQGGAVGILYLTVFAALRLYHLISVSAAFGLLALIAAGSALLAVVQSSLWFALLGVSGGFLAPVLASTGAGSHVVLFGYYAVLNAGILAVAWFKAWRPLNLAGFVFTFAIGTAWGVLRYQPQDFATTEPFLVLFFLFYVGIAALFTLRQPPNLKGYVDATLVFGTPLAAFGLQALMLHDRLLALACSALAVSALYLAMAWLLKRRSAAQGVLADAFLALGVVFLTVAVPLALGARWNAVTWALEGAGLVWLGCRQGRVLARAAGALLIVAAGFLVARRFDLAPGHRVLSGTDYSAALTLTAACLAAAGSFVRLPPRLSPAEEWVAPGLFLWGLLWWLLGGLAQVFHYFPDPGAAGSYGMAASLVFLALTALASSELHRLLPFGAVRTAALLLLPVLLLYAALEALLQPHPFAQGGWLAWPLAFAIWYRIMYRQEGLPPLSHVLNAASGWLLCLVSSWEAAWAVDGGLGASKTWTAVAWAAIPALALFFMPRWVQRLPWPCAKHRDLYLLVVAPGLAAYLGTWSLLTNLVLPGSADPLPYVPLLNPLDLAQALVLAVLARHFLLRDVAPHIEARRVIPGLIALVFVWLNAALLRTLHHWFGIPFDWGALLASTLVETALSIFWAILALGTMLLAARKGHRRAWLTGASLLAVVIVKLFFADLSRSGSIERIVSFVGVGVLMLVVGYFSPLPPASSDEAA